MKKFYSIPTKGNFLFALLLFFSILSKGQDYYAPNNGYLVNLTQRNDLHISGYFQPFSNEKEIVNLQLGFSPIKYFGIMGSHFNYNKSHPKANIFKDTQISLWDYSAGFYFPFLKKSNFLDSKSANNFHNDIFNPSGLIFDIFVGQSIGEVRNFYDNIGSNHFKIRKNYIQFGFHLQHKFLGVHMSTRIGTIKFSDGIVQGGTTFAVQKTIDEFNEDNDFILIESTFQLDVGIRYGKIVLASSRAKDNRQLFNLGIINQVITLGAFVDIDEFFRKKKIKN